MARPSDPKPEPDKIVCDFCGEDCEDGRELVILNRFLVGEADSMRAIEMHGAPGYVWRPEKEEFSGRAVCWPHCAMSYLDGFLIQQRYDQQRGR